jgi:hypothetical protein
MTSDWRWQWSWDPNHIYMRGWGSVFLLAGMAIGIGSVLWKNHKISKRAREHK